MTFFLRSLLIVLLMMGSALAQERKSALPNDTEIADPAPDWDNPRKIVLQVTSKDEFHVNNVYYNAINLQNSMALIMSKSPLFFMVPAFVRS